MTRSLAIAAVVFLTLSGIAGPVVADHVPAFPVKTPPELSLIATLWTIAANDVHSIFTGPVGNQGIYYENTGHFLGAANAIFFSEVDAWASKVQGQTQEIGTDDPLRRLDALTSWAETTSDQGETRFWGTVDGLDQHGAGVIYTLDEQGRLWLELLVGQGATGLTVLLGEGDDLADIAHLLRPGSLGNPLDDPTNPSTYLDAPVVDYLAWKGDRILAALQVVLDGLGHEVDRNLNMLGDDWEIGQCQLLEPSLKGPDEANCVADAALDGAEAITNSAWDFDRDALGVIGEFRWGTNLLDQDSDDDGWPDGLEAEYWTRTESTIVSSMTACADGSGATCSWYHPDAYRDTDEDDCPNMGSVTGQCQGDQDSDTKPGAAIIEGDHLTDGDERYGCTNPRGENDEFTDLDRSRTLDPLGLFTWKPCGSQPGGDSTLPDVADSDFDGLTEGEEFLVTLYGEERGYGTDANNGDTDGDQWGDGAEADYYLAGWKNDAYTDQDGNHGILDLDADRDGIMDGSEITAAYETRPDHWDSDDDALPDPWENAHALNPTATQPDCKFVDPSITPTEGDTDGDGLCDRAEYGVFAEGRNEFLEGPLSPAETADPTLSDSDGEGLTDLEEVQGTLNPVFIHDAFIPGYAGSTSPYLRDTDGDDVDDLTELLARKNPNDGGDGPTDSDLDGLADSIERQGWRIGVDEEWIDVDSTVGPQDSDEDGILDLQEYLDGTNPKKGDTDGDGWTDVEDATCDAARKDADADGIPDPQETLTSCLDADSDGDGIQDLTELEGWLLYRDMDGDGTFEPPITVRSDPLLPDSDADGLQDADELLGHTDPSDLDGDTDGDQQTDLEEYLAAESLPEVFNSPVQAASAEAEQFAAPPADAFAAGGLLWGPPTQGFAGLPQDGSSDTPDGGPSACPLLVHPANDWDCDWLRDDQELARGTKDRDPDTDGDGLMDGAEVWNFHTDPLTMDTDQDGAPDGVDLRPLEEDRHPVLAVLESSDYFSGLTVGVKDQSLVHVVEEEIMFYDPELGFECDESFTTHISRRAYPLYGPGDEGYYIEFHVGYFRDDMAYSANGNHCGQDFVILLPFRDAHGNTMQIELTSHAKHVCVIDPVEIAMLAMGILPAPAAVLPRRAAVTFHTALIAASAIQPNLELAADNIDGMVSMEMQYLRTDAGASPIGALSWLGAAYSAMSIATGDYRTCKDSTTVQRPVTLESFPDEPLPAVTDLRGRNILFSEGVMEYRPHPMGTWMGEEVRGFGEVRAEQDSSGYQAWVAEVLQHPAWDFAWPPESHRPTYHVYCPQDTSQGYVITGEVRPGSNRALFVTAHSALVAEVPAAARACPTPASVLP